MKLRVFLSLLAGVAWTAVVASLCWLGGMSWFWEWERGRQLVGFTLIGPVNSLVIAVGVFALTGIGRKP